MNNGKYHYQILPCANSRYNEPYFSNKSDWRKKNLFLTNSRKLLNKNNKAVKEGKPYVLAKVKDIEYINTKISELRKIKNIPLENKDQKNKKGRK